MILTFLLAVVSTAALLSLGLYIGLAYWGHSRMLYSTALNVLPSWRDRIFLLLAAAGLLTCLYQGAYAMLFWLPSTWGAIDESGEYQTLATSFALLFTSGGLFLIAFIDKASHEKVWLRVTREQVNGLSEILRASLDRSTLAKLGEDYAKQAAQLASTLSVLPPFHTDADIRHYMGPTRERIAVLEELSTAASEQRKRLEKAGG
jgi:hypothetical protein